MGKGKKRAMGIMPEMHFEEGPKAKLSPNSGEVALLSYPASGDAHTEYTVDSIHYSKWVYTLSEDQW